MGGRSRAESIAPQRGAQPFQACIGATRAAHQHDEAVRQVAGSTEEHPHSHERHPVVDAGGGVAQPDLLLVVVGRDGLEDELEEEEEQLPHHEEDACRPIWRFGIIPPLIFPSGQFPLCAHYDW